MPVASLEDRKQVKTAERKTSLSKIAILSKENIAARKARENGSALVVSGQSPLEKSDVEPFMPAHNKAADQAVDYVTNGLNHISQKFNGVRLYALTEDAVQKSVAKIGAVVFQEQAVRELVNTLMRNMDAHLIFSEKLTRVRMATLNQDVAVLVDELLEFAKFFDGNLWSGLNVISETVWNKTGFAIGKPERNAKTLKRGIKAKIKNTFRGFHLEGFSRDFHLKWKRLLRDPFVKSVMGSVAEAAKSLASYRDVDSEFLRKRKAIESEIGKAPVLAKIQDEITKLCKQHAEALSSCNQLKGKLEERKRNPKGGIKITEPEIQSARAKANQLDYAIEKATTRDNVAIGSVEAADENADMAKLPGIAIQMHVRAVADLFFNAGLFVLKTAAFFTAQNLLDSANQAQSILQQGRNVAKSHEVGQTVSKLSEITKGSPDANTKVTQSVDKAVIAHKEAKTALSKMQAPVRITDSTEEDSCELIWYCFQTLTEPKFCKLCEREINSDEMVARPHYCEHRTGGVPETIKQDGKPVVANWYVCHECFTELTEIKNRRLAQGEKLVIHDANCGKH